MAFYDEPVVDDSAKKSEESVNAVKSLLTYRNGFISRVETPDYGVDFNVELVSKMSGATSQMFPVQIKSTKRVTVITHGGERLIALPFKTSRLGYLCRRIPISGIVVVYDDETKTCYFDYVDAIMQRLDNEHGEADWRPQASVAVHLPLQVLDQPALRAMHRKFSQAHERHQLMLRSQGPNYGLTTYEFNAPATAPPDLHDPKQVAEVLERLGPLLYNAQEFDKLLYLLGRLSGPAIASSKAILFVAALTHAHLGNVLEAEYYLTKCARQTGGWDAVGTEALEFARIRIAFIKGDASPGDYRQKLTDLQAHATSPLNALTFELNVHYLDLLASFDDERKSPGIATITNVFQAIEAAPLEAADKQLLKLFNSDNLHNAGCLQLLKEASRFIAQDKFAIPVDPAVRLRRAQAIADTIAQAVKTVEEVTAYAKEHNNRLLHAQALQHSSRFFLSLHYSLMMLHIGEPAELSSVLHAQYVQKFDAGVAAYNTYLKLHMLKDAHQMLSTCYELQMLFYLRYGQSLGGQPLEELLRVLRAIEQEAGLPAFESDTQAAYEGMNRRLAGPRLKLTDIPEGQIPDYASRYLELVGLPADRLPFLVAEIEAFQLFARECRDEALELVADGQHLQDNRTAYARPTSYVVRNKMTGRCSSPANDVRQLLADAEQFREEF